MKRPIEVWVSGLPFQVIYDAAALGLKAMDERAEPALGHCDYSTLTMVVDDRMPEPKIRDTLFHEILHAIWHTTGLTSRVGTEISEEEVVAAMATEIVHVLRVNDDLAAYLRWHTS